MKNLSASRYFVTFLSFFFVVPIFSCYRYRFFSRIDETLKNHVLTTNPDVVQKVMPLVDDMQRSDSVKILLVGRPGVGKSTFAQAVAAVSARQAYYFYSPILNSDTLATNFALVEFINSLAQQKQPTLALFEVTAFPLDRYDTDFSAIFALVNALHNAANASLVSIICLDTFANIPPLLSEEFDQVIYYDLPDEEQREQVIGFYRDPALFAHSFSKIELARETHGFTEQELADIMKTAIKKVKTGNDPELRVTYEYCLEQVHALKMKKRLADPKFQTKIQHMREEEAIETLRTYNWLSTGLLFFINPVAAATKLMLIDWWV